MSLANKEFSNWVKAIRTQLGISQEDFAQQLGVCFATVNRWENEQCSPSKLAKMQIELFQKNMLAIGKLSPQVNQTTENKAIKSESY